MKNVDPLHSWSTLNTFVMKADEKQCEDLLAKAVRRGVSKRFVLRIHSRINRLRAHRERKELASS